MPHRSELPAAKGGLSGRGHSKGHGHDPRVVNTATALGSAPQEGIYDEFVAKCVEAAEKRKLGDPADPSPVLARRVRIGATWG